MSAFLRLCRAPVTSTLRSSTSLICRRMSVSSRLPQLNSSPQHHRHTRYSMMHASKPAVVPVIDLAPFLIGTAEGKSKVAKAFNQACERIGFMTVVGHGVDRQIVQRAWEATRMYFDLPVAEKNLVPMAHDYPYGYIGFGEENLAAGYNQGRHTPDLKECFCIGPYNAASGMPAIRWPPNQLFIQKAWLEYYQALEKLASNILRAFAVALELPENFFEDKIDKHRSAFRMLNYPPQDVPPLPGQIRAGEHTDYGTITILKSDDNVSGLQVKDKEGKWHYVSPVPDSFVINIGDLMQRWTNDRWVSTVHRVVNPPGQVKSSERRQSMAFFHNLNGDALVETIPSCITPNNPSKYPPIQAWKHLMEKHEASTTGSKH